MPSFAFRVARRLAKEVGYELRKMPSAASDAFAGLIAARDGARKIDGDTGNFLSFCFENADRSYAQFMQDLFVAYVLNQKESGFFVEFGATDGVDLSNTKLLETDYKWKGILAEPARTWHSSLRSNRQATLDFRCVTGKTGGEVDFFESDLPELSTLSGYASRDYHARERTSGKTYAVETVSLLDLLIENHAPQVIDYLSLDTEGSELAILEDFDFSKFQINVITVEHNFSQTRKPLHDLLVSKGFQNVFRELSQVDDWYVANPR